MKNSANLPSGRYAYALAVKTGLRVRLSLLFFLMILCQIGTAHSYAQKTRISLDVESASVIDVLDKIQSITAYKFFYSEEDLDLSRKISLKVKNKSIVEVLDEMFGKTDTSYEIVGDQIVLKRRAQTIAPKTDATPPPKQPITISGRVSDERGVGIPGASVVVKGSFNGTSTNAEGDYRISANPTDTLEFSSIGYQRKVVPVLNQTVINVVLAESVTSLGEVEIVATGLFTRDKESYTGSVTTVTREDLTMMNNQNVLAGLANIDPSFVQIENLSTGSDPNQVPNYQLRGTSGISVNLQSQYETDPNQPLFILDGFQTTITKIKDLDVNLIESITLLKDATAKAVYGSKGANGVIVVQTRRPEGGKLRVNYTGTMSLEMPDLTSYNLANAEEKLAIEKMAGLYESEAGSFEEQLALDQTYSDKMLEVEKGVNTNWLAKPVRTGIGQRHSLYLDGGEHELLYGIELSYNDISGAMKGSERTTFTGGVTLTYRKNNVLVRNRLAITQNNSSDSPYGDFSLYAAMNPYYRVRDEDGNLIQEYDFDGTEQTNPIWNAHNNTNYTSQYTDITDNFYGEWGVAAGLKIVGQLGITNRKLRSDIFKPASHTDFVDVTDVYAKGSYTQTNGDNNYANGNLGLSYSHSWGKHLLTGNVQGNFSSTSYESVTMVAEGFANERMDHIIFAVQYADGEAPYGSEGISHSAGGLMSFNYAYDERFLVDGNYRLSGSSEYGANKRWGNFWSFGGGWNIHHEAFMASTPFTLLKLRGSLGYTGSQGFNTYEALSTVKYYTSQQYMGYIGSYLVSMANNNLRWQSKYDQNIGVDFALLSNRFRGRVDYYVSNTEAMLTDVTLPESTGFSYYRDNLGKVENKGIEVSLNARPYQSKNGRNFVNVYLNASHNKNTLKKISNSLKAFNETQDEDKTQEDSEDAYDEITTPSVRYVEGKSINTVWAVRSLGIDPQSGLEIFQKSDGTVTYTWDANDQIAAGNSLPRVTGNIGFNGEFHNIGWNVACYYRLGGKMYNATLVDKVENANLAYNVDRRVFTDRWQQAGDHARFKSITDDTYTRPTSRFVEDNNSLTLSSVNVYYDFRDTRWVKASALQRLRCSVNLNNIFVVSSIKTERGTSYPFARNATLTLSATF